MKPPMNPNSVGLPVRPFLYTIDQIAALLELKEDSVKSTLIFFFGRNPGHRPLDLLLARNIAAPGEKPEWRVAEQELVRWMRRKGFRVYQHGWALR